MLEILLLPFFQRALIVGLIIGSLMAALGTIVVLRKMSFFADAIGHSALTGIALGLLLAINPFVAAVIFTCVVALSISITKQRSRLPIDTLLGIFFPPAVAAGVILVQLTPGYQTDLIAFLFGDILTVTPTDIITSIILSIVIAALLVVNGKKLIKMTFSEDIAHSEGIAVARVETVFLIMLAIVIAVAIKIVGIILVTALLVIPAATAQNLTKSISHLFAVSIVINIIAVTIGMLMSAALNVASGPAIVITAAGLFVISLFLKK